MSTEHNDGGPAFPHAHEDYPFQQGMSLRDWFAGQALSGIMSKVPVTATSFAADVAVECADAVLAALKRKEEG